MVVPAKSSRLVGDMRGKKGSESSRVVIPPCCLRVGGLRVPGILNSQASYPKNPEMFCVVSQLFLLGGLKFSRGKICGETPELVGFVPILRKLVSEMFQSEKLG